MIIMDIMTESDGAERPLIKSNFKTLNKIVFIPHNNYDYFIYLAKYKYPQGARRYWRWREMEKKVEVRKEKEEAEKAFKDVKLFIGA